MTRRLLLASMLTVGCAARRHAIAYRTDTDAQRHTRIAIRLWAARQPGYDGRLSAHEWNYGRRVVTGRTGPAPHEIGLGDGCARIMAYEYFAAMGDRL